MFRLALRHAFAYRVSVFVGMGMLAFEVFLLRRIWTAVYGGQSSVDGLSLDALIIYVTLANLQAFAMWSLLTWQIPWRVRQGSVFFDLVRPFSWPRQMIGLQMGTSFGRLLLMLPAVPIAFLVGSIAAPASAAAGIGYVISLLLGYAISVQLSLLVGMIAFWTVEINGFATFYRLISTFFAGTMVPLTFFPGPLKTIADLLPFRFLGYVPAGIYVGAVSGAQLIEALVTQVVWFGMLSGLVWLVWRRAHRRLVVQGG